MLSQLNPSLLARKYNPEVYYAEALENIETQSPEDILQWLSHPLTKAVLLQLEGDMTGLFILWQGGAYTSEDSAEGTGLRNVKALAQAQTIDDVIQAIRTIGLPEEDVYDTPSRL